MRCSNPAVITDRSCYEANIFDTRKDPTYGTGGIVHFAEVNPMPKAGGKWNTYEITAKGRQITVTLNGSKTAELHNGLFVEGPDHAPAWCRRDQVPQGCHQAALVESAEDFGDCHLAHAQFPSPAPVRRSPQGEGG